MKNESSTKAAFSRNIQFKKAMYWLTRFFHLGTENNEKTTPYNYDGHNLKNKTCEIHV